MVTPTVTPKNAKTNSYASGFGNSRLAHLVSQAFDLRETAYLPDACEAIVDEWRRRGLVWRHEENLWLEGLESSGRDRSRKAERAQGFKAQSADRGSSRPERLEGASPIRTAGESSATEPVDGAGLSVAAQPSPSTHLWWAA